MSDDVHYSDSTEGKIPKHFLCGKKRKELPFTRVLGLVDCPQCRAKLLERSNAASKPSKEET